MNRATLRRLAAPWCLAAAAGCSDDVAAVRADATVADVADVAAVDASRPDGDAPAVDVVTTDVPAPAQPPVRASAPLVRYVDPRLGTGGDGYGVGSAFPGAQRPFGLARPGPDTTDAAGNAIGFAHCAGYAAVDGFIAGFGQTHLHGTGIVDQGALGVMPTIGMTAAKTRQQGYLLPFHHDAEAASPGYYRVAFDGAAITTEVTATAHVAMYRKRFAPGADAAVLLDVGHTISDVHVTTGRIEVDAAAGEVRGSVHLDGGYSGRTGGVETFFVARLSRPLDGAGTWSAGVLAPTLRAQEGTAVGAWVPVDTRTDASVTVAIGLSMTDVAHARANLAAEAADLDFDRVRADAAAEWERALGRVQVTARGDAALQQFYTAVYHTLLMPTLLSDTDGSYRGVDGQVHQADGWRYYSDLSLWDTFRTEHPWLSLVYPDYQRDFVRSAVAMAQALGFFPRWPLGTGETGGMLGDCGALMVADSWLRGVRDFDAEAAWRIARSAALGSRSRRERLDDYMALHWVPADGGEKSAAQTLEYAYADGALGRWGAALGHTDDAAVFTARSAYYRNLYDPAQRFLVGRRRDGTFVPLVRPDFFDPVYAEGDAWHYLWLAPHDLPGLATLLGGRDALLARLDEMMQHTLAVPRTPVLPEPWYWQGNEPDIHAPWIPSAFDAFATTSRYVDFVRTHRFGLGPGGLPGNDDAGTMSAWYVFASLGMYPLAGTDTWLLAAPSVTEATLALAGGATLHVTAPAGGTGAYDAASIRWGGAALAHPTLTQAQVGAGGELSLDLR